MASIDSIKYDIKRYQNLKRSINAIISNLESYNDQVDELAKNIDKLYQVDNVQVGIVKRINSVKIDVQKTSNYLKITIIPAVESSINRLTQTLAQMEAAEEAARRVLEQQERSRKNTSQNSMLM